MQSLILALVLSIGVSGLLILAVGVLRRRLRVIGLLSFPLYVGAVAAGLKVFSLFEVEQIEGLDEIISWVLVFLLSIVVLRVLGLYYFEVHLHANRGIRLPPLLPQVAMWALYLIAALVTLKTFFPETEFTGILTASAITSLVLGLALQPILGNLFAGLAISLERPFRINDWITYEEIEARVVDISWRTTHLRTRDNDSMVVPNSRIADQRILNHYYPHSLHMERIYVGAHYRTPPYRVKQAIIDACQRVDGVLEKPSVEVFVVEFDAYAVRYEARIWIEDFAHKPRIASHAHSEIWEEFARRGITIPFPIRTLEIEPRAGTLKLQRAERVEQRDLAHAYPARLFVAHGSSRGRVLALTGEPVKVGRSEECDLAIVEPNASKEHFSVAWSEGNFVLTDLQSRYGTRINGVRSDRKLLRHLDRIEIGDTVLVFEIDGD